jgi:hypothetical protein
MDRADIAILISVLAFGVACASLAWNIFRELWLRPRLRVSIDVAAVGSEIMKPERKLMISGTNFGPGKIRVSFVRCDRNTFLSRLLRKATYGFVIHDYKNPISGQLPATLDVGERIDLIFPFEKDSSILAQSPTRVGLRDYFGRDHWAPKKSLRRAQADYDRFFGATANRPTQD